MQDQEKMMARIAALIAKAESTTFPEEAASYTAKAEELMRRYRIEESQIESADGPVLPTFRKIQVTQGSGEFTPHQYWIWLDVAKHAGVMSEIYWEPSASGGGYVAETVGYDIDIRLAEMIFNSARLAFLFALDPSNDPSVSVGENIYRMRSAGMDRQLIAEKVLGKRGHAEGLKVGQIYRDECAARGEDAVVSGRSFNAKTYREVYAREFVNRVETRLRRARFAADSLPGLPVSVSRPLAVQEAFWTRFPSRRPKPVDETADVVCEATPSKKPSKGITKAQEARLERLYYGATARAARNTAVKAADSIQLGRETTGAVRVEPGADGKALEG